jgi:hypothetical protein
MRVAVALLLVLNATAAAAQQPVDRQPAADVPSVTLTITYAALVGADVGATVSCTTRHACREVNPAYRWLSHDGAAFGAARAAVGAATVYAVHRWTKPRTWPRYVALGSLVVIQGVVVAQGRRF